LQHNVGFCSAEAKAERAGGTPIKTSSFPCSLTAGPGVFLGCVLVRKNLAPSGGNFGQVGEFVLKWS